MSEDSSKRPTLGELLSEEKSMMEIILSSEGEILPSLEFALKENEDSLKQKIDAYAYQIKRFEAEALFRKEEAAHQKNIQKTCENIAQRMKDSLKEFMQHYDKKELLGHKDGFMIYESGAVAVELKDGVTLDAVPKEFIRTKVLEDLNRTAVADAYKNQGEERKQLLEELFEFKKTVTIRFKPNTYPKLAPEKIK